MPQGRGGDQNQSYSITMPKAAIEMIHALIPTGLFGSNRAEISKTLILDQLKRSEIQQLIDKKQMDQ